MTVPTSHSLQRQLILTQNGCILGRWMQVCKSGWRKHFSAAKPGHRVALEVSRGAHANATQYLTIVGVFAFFQYLIFHFMVNKCVYELRLNIQSFPKYLCHICAFCLTKEVELNKNRLPSSLSTTVCDA